MQRAKRDTRGRSATNPSVLQGRAVGTVRQKFADRSDALRCQFLYVGDAGKKWRMVTAIFFLGLPSLITIAVNVCIQNGII